MEAREALRRAAELAAQGRFRVEPNPPVGCILVKDGRVVGEGFHGRWGGLHAEVRALRAAGESAKGATAYVTLEPCGHKGKTPPCADALIRAGVREVVYAQADPNPVTAGLGPATLAEAGVAVRKAPGPPQATRALLDAYLAHLPGRRPWVLAKWAMTLDGRIASRRGDSRWISSEQSRNWAHRVLRGGVDAILVGAGTVRADDPDLSNRIGRSQPLRVVVCGRRPLPRGARVLKGSQPTLLAVPEHFRAPRGVEIVRCGTGGRVQVRRLLRELVDRGIRRVLVEGGGDLLGSLFDRKLVDQVCVFLAPKVIGGLGAVNPVAGKGVATIAGAFELDHATNRALGPDVLVEAYVRRS